MDENKYSFYTSKNETTSVQIRDIKSPVDISESLKYVWEMNGTAKQNTMVSLSNLLEHSLGEDNRYLTEFLNSFMRIKEADPDIFIILKCDDKRSVTIDTYLSLNKSLEFKEDTISEEDASVAEIYGSWGLTVKTHYVYSGGMGFTVEHTVDAELLWYSYNRYDNTSGFNLYTIDKCAIPDMSDTDSRSTKWYKIKEFLDKKIEEDLEESRKAEENKNEDDN